MVSIRPDLKTWYNKVNKFVHAANWFMNETCIILNLKFGFIVNSRDLNMYRTYDMV